MLNDRKEMKVTIDTTEAGQELVSTIVGGFIVTTAVAGFYKCATAAVTELGSLMKTCSNNRACRKEAEMKYKTRLAECKMEEIK